jgi:NAD+ kinase
MRCVTPTTLNTMPRPVVANFQHIGLLVNTKSHLVLPILSKLIPALQTYKLTICCESQEALQHFLPELQQTLAPLSAPQCCEYTALPDSINLMLVIGGDGSMLRAARNIVKRQLPVVGINAGNLGFMTDLTPENMLDYLPAILSGHYLQEERTLLQLQVAAQQHLALNDVVLFNSDVSRMIEFHVTIDQQPILHLRADGIIVATPTGSTAYALSAGGPMITPTLPVILLVPMFSHSLNSRPIIVPDNVCISIMVATHKASAPRISCDGQVHLSLQPGEIMHINKAQETFTILHPEQYNYFRILQEKFGL